MNQQYLKGIILTLAVMIGSMVSQAQDLSMISREQAREVVNMICQQSGNNSAMLESTTGLSGIKNINSIVDGHTLEMKYIISGYTSDNTPEEQAFTQLCLAGGGRQMSTYQIDMMTGIFEKAGYDLRIVYTDGGKNTCVVTPTPAQLNMLWKGDLAGAGIKRDMVVKGILKSLSAGTQGASSEEFEDLKVYADGSWATIEMIMPENSDIDSVSPEELKRVLLQEYSTTPVVAKMAGNVVPFIDFIGINGIKVVFGKKNGSKRDVYLTWAELMNNI